MKLATFSTPGLGSHVGVVLEETQEIVDLTSAARVPHFASMIALIEGGADGLSHAADVTAAGRSRVGLRDVTLLAPLPEPRQMRDFLAFEKHLRQARANRHIVPDSGIADRIAPEDVVIPPEWYASPLYYRPSNLTVVGTDKDIVYPGYTAFLDFELELAAVTGARGKDIGPAEAYGHIFGFCIFNDFSARDAQYRSMRANMGGGKGKDFDGSNALGPWIVTADEIGDPYDLTMVARINGEEVSRGHSGEMYHRFEDMICYVSVDETIYPGEVLGSGTVGGGCGLEIGRPLQVGDTIELEISRVGTLRNRIVGR